MRKLQDDSEAAFSRRLESIPDGTWTEEGWLEVSLPGDRGLYRNRVTLTKSGDTLTFSNEGSAPQEGTLNGVPSPAWKGAVVSMLASQMLYDQMFVIEGALRHCEFDVEPGTDQLRDASGRRLRRARADPAPLDRARRARHLEDARHVDRRGAAAPRCRAAWASSRSRSSPSRGSTSAAPVYSSFLLDPVGSALSALSWRDGQDTGGWPWDLQSTMPNVEDNELFYPILYLWRKELPELGRGGHVPRRQRRRAGDRAAQDRRDEPLHDHERARRARAGALRRLVRARRTSTRSSRARRCRSSSRARAACRPTSSRARRRARLGAGEVVRPGADARRRLRLRVGGRLRLRRPARPRALARRRRRAPRAASPPTGARRRTASCSTATARSTRPPPRRGGRRSARSASPRRKPWSGEEST